MQTIYIFNFDLIETSDLKVFVAGELVEEYSAYTVSPGFEDGGEIVFAVAPDQGDNVRLERDTTISQQVDYEPFTPFPTETHEWNLDKITKILQELNSGGIFYYDDDGNLVLISFDLEGVPTATTVNITNSGGTDASIPVWESGTLAGVYIGETSPAGNIPADGAATSQPDGYVWLGV